MALLRTSRGDFEAIIEGPANGPLILLLHGFPTSSHMYRNLIPRLADRWHVVAPDLPGFGFSGAPAREAFAYRFDAIARLVERFTETIGLARFAVDGLAPDAAGLPVAVLLVPLAFSAVQGVHFFSYILTYQLRHGDHAPLASGEGRASFLKSVLSVPTDYGLLCLVMALRFAPVVFLWVYGLMLVGFAAYLGLALPKWYLELRRQG